MKKTLNISRKGLTLVELLVVIAIMGLLTALIVPQVRLVNKDRNIREAARVVGTALAQARDRAIANGSAGLMIERNQNLVQNFGGNDFYYGGTRLYLMRNVPNYTDNYGSNKGCMITPVPQAVVNAGKKRYVYIRMPFRENVIKVGDEIAFGRNATRYLITECARGTSNPDIPAGQLDNDGTPWPVQTRLTIDLGLDKYGNTPPSYIYKRPLRNTNLPDPNQPAPDGSIAPPEEVAYVIFRQPRKMESSRVDLPEGYIIDLRYSGPIAPEPNKTPTTEFSRENDFYHVHLFFGEDGGLSHLGLGGNAGIPVSESIDLFVTEYRPEDVIDVEDVNMDGVDIDDIAYQVLNNPAALWVTLGSQTGGVNVGYNTPPANSGVGVNDGVDAMIQSARQTSRTRTSANQ